MPAGAILIRGARQLLTLSGQPRSRRGRDLGEVGLIKDGAILICDGRIERVGTTRSIENLAAAKNAFEIDATGRVVMPAFVDCRAALLQPDSEPEALGRLVAAAHRTVNGCVRHGTGTIEVRCGSGTNEASDLRMLRCAPRLENALQVVSAYGPATPSMRDPSAHWVGTSLMPAIRKKQLARYAMMFCGNGTSTPVETRRYADFCRRLGLGIKIEVAPEKEALHGALACEPATIEGLWNIGDDEARAVARSEAIAVLLPAGAFHHRERQPCPPARRLIDAGAAVALASGFRHSDSVTFSMQMVIALAAAHTGMSPAEAICAATINGAYASGVGDRTGSLEHGKNADIIILNVSDYHEMFRQVGANLVETVVNQGRIVYRESTLR
jgi:imidazolonepropionase